MCIERGHSQEERSRASLKVCALRSAMYFTSVTKGTIQRLEAIPVVSNFQVDVRITDPKKIKSCRTKVVNVSEHESI
jgi:hypothetical protein